MDQVDWYGLYEKWILGFENAIQLYYTIPHVTSLLISTSRRQYIIHVPTFLANTTLPKYTKDSVWYGNLSQENNEW